MITRRDTFKLAAGAATTVASGPDPAIGMPAPFADVTTPAAAILDGIDTGALGEMVCVRCTQAKAEYEAALQAVLALDPAFSRFRHPVTRLDEAALGLYLTGIDEGLKLGMAAGMAEGIRLHLAAYRAEFRDTD